MHMLVDRIFAHGNSGNVKNGASTWFIVKTVERCELPLGSPVKGFDNAFDDNFWSYRQKWCLGKLNQAAT